MTEKGFQRESKLTMEIAALRGRLRRAGLLDEGPRMPRKTLVRASRQSDSDDDDEDDAAVSQGSLDRPTTIAEEEEEGEAGAEEDEVLVGDEGPAVSGADRSASGSNGANVDEVGEDERLAATETPVAGEGHYDVPEGAVQSHRGGGMAISITEVAGAPLEGFPLAGQQVRATVGIVMVLVRSQARLLEWLLSTACFKCMAMWQHVPCCSSTTPRNHACSCRCTELRM